MTPKEAIDNISEIQCIVTDAVPACDPEDNWGRYTIALNIAKKALERQIPKKPLNRSDEYDRMYGNCPCCGKMVVDYPDDFRVCSNCGQRLDWGDEE